LALCSIAGVRRRSPQQKRSVADSRSRRRHGISLPGYSSQNRIIGIDLSEAMLRKAQRRVAGLSLTNVEKLEVMDAEPSVIRRRFVRRRRGEHVISTVPNPEAALDECARMSGPAAEMILVSRIGADAGLRHLVERLLQPIVRRLGWRLEFPWGRFARWTEREPIAPDRAPADAAVWSFLAPEICEMRARGRSMSTADRQIRD